MILISTLFIITAFRVDKEYSIHYAKCRDIEELKKQLEIALSKDPDYISIRKIRKIITPEEFTGTDYELYE